MCHGCFGSLAEAVEVVGMGIQMVGQVGGIGAPEGVVARVTHQGLRAK